MAAVDYAAGSTATGFGGGGGGGGGEDPFRQKPGRSHEKDRFEVPGSQKKSEYSFESKLVGTDRVAEYPKGRWHITVQWRNGRYVSGE